MSGIISFLLKHKIFVFSVILIASAVLYLTLPREDKNKPSVIYPTPTTVPLNPSTLPGRLFEGQRTTIGQTTEGQLRSLPNLEKEEISPDGGTMFLFKSSLIDRPNSVSTNRTGIAVFERIVVPSSTSAALSQMKSSIGEAEATIEGSSYGKAVNTYIYSSRGLAILANPYADEIYEVQIFQPMSTSSYSSRYADTGNAVNAQEGN